MTEIAASKQRGMWMGGYPALGYDVEDRKLVINEAAAVRHIFERYIVLKSVRELRNELHNANICSKARTGQRPGARPLARGALYLMLQNRLYRGEIIHKGQAYPGQHQSIVDPELWDRVQATLEENRVERSRGGGASQPSLLAGLILDGAGGRMSPSHANKKGTRYRYDVSQSLIKQSRADAPAASCRVPAGDLEAIVATSLCNLLLEQAAIYDLARAAFADTTTRKAMLAATADLSRNLPAMPAGEKITMFRLLIGGIIIRADTVEITFRGEGLAKIVQPGFEAASTDLPVITRTVSARLKRTGMETKLLIDGPATVREPDRSLLRLLARAHQFHRAMMASHGTTMRELASEAGVGPSYFARVVRLAFLCPGITRAIPRGRHPTLTANKLQHVSQLPNGWIDQRRQLQLT